jgi:glycosyltransferase involved in cell wall biosynthesis
MKIMTAMYTLKRGGSYDRFKMLIEAFLDRECEVHCLSLTPIEIEHPLFHNHVMHLPFKKVGGLIGKLVVLSMFPIWSVWVGWRNRIDLIIAFGSLYAFVQGLTKCFLKRPLVTLIRGDSRFGLRMQNSSKYTLYLNKGIENMGLNSSDLIITNNTALREEILKSLRKGKHIDVKVLLNNILSIPSPHLQDIPRTRAKYGIPEDAKVLVTAGVLNQGKNIEVLINSLPRIEMKNLHLLVVGDGSTEADFQYRDFLKARAKELKVEERVIFTGWVEKEELWKIYLASDLFVMPSINEGMPNAMLEALGIDLPCIGSRISGVKDILQHEELMFDPKDEKDILRKISRFFSDEQLSNHIAELCRGRKKDFFFDWKEKVFQMATKRIFNRGEGSQG